MNQYMSIILTLVSIGAAVCAAWYGARIGAHATIEAAKLSLQETARAEQEQRKVERHRALVALRDELHMNSAIASQWDTTVRIKLFWVPFFTHSLSNARRYLDTVPFEVRSTIEEAGNAIDRFNSLAQYSNSNLQLAETLNDDLMNLLRDVDRRLRTAGASLFEYIQISHGV